MSFELINLWNWGHEIFENLVTRIVVSVMILVIGFIIARIVQKVTLKTLKDVGLDEASKKLGFKKKLSEIIANILQFCIGFFSVILALDQLGIRTAVLNMVGAAVLLVLLLVIFLGVKDLIPNLVSGTFILKKKFLKEGDRIKVKGVTGTIKSISITETKIETESGDTLIIPNSILTKAEIIKFKKNKN